MVILSMMLVVIIGVNVVVLIIIMIRLFGCAWILWVGNVGLKTLSRTFYKNIPNIYRVIYLSLSSRWREDNGA